ncbi:hypothetical protein ACRQ4B_08035 [Curtobacterium sp. SP.BCo]|uniref:hypothetical protein n=1 Tax=Curtobacterium sp. SP.BCo TaxID=3435229 RepID=UPI003F736B9E
MQDITGVRVVSAAATVAALVFGVQGLSGGLPSLFGASRPVWFAATVVGGLAAALVLVVALRARDRRATAAAVSMLAFAVAWFVPGPVGSALSFVAQAALVAFGLLTVWAVRGVQRVLGWVVTTAAALWFVVGLLTQTVFVPGASQELLVVVFSIPVLLQAVAYLATAVLVAAPLLRTVGAGAGRLWDSAEVR